MSLQTVLVSIETAALDALKEAGTVLEGFVITEGQKLVAEVKQTNVGTTALNIISALESNTMSGPEKLETVVAALIPLITKLSTAGGLTAAITSVESFALELAQSVYQDFKQNVVAKI